MGETGDDLYDDIFDNAKETISSNSVDVDDLYGDIYNPEVAESALSRVKLLSSENERFKGQNTQLKEQITILTRINHDYYNSLVSDWWRDCFSIIGQL